MPSCSTVSQGGKKEHRIWSKYLVTYPEKEKKMYENGCGFVGILVNLLFGERSTVFFNHCEAGSYTLCSRRKSERNCQF